MAEINVVPYVDVSLVLLIIFMVTAPIVQQAVTVDLPDTPSLSKKAKSATQQVTPLVITVTKNGFYQTSEKPDSLIGQKDMAKLIAEVVARSQLDPNKPFYIQGDKEAPYGKVIHLFVLLKSNGVEQVSLMTQPENN